MTDSETRTPTILDIIETRRESVNNAIPEHLPIQEPERLYEASRYILEAGGKRLRPTILLLVAEALTDQSDTLDYRSAPPVSDPVTPAPTGAVTGTSILDAAVGGSTGRGGPVNVMAAAVSVELIQSFTLIHDDIMDDDDLRRGVPAVHREYDLETAILAGDTLYAKAFEFMLETGASADRTVRSLNVLARTCTEICEGQALDVEFETRDDVTVEEYLTMIRQKTAVLYGASATIPAVLLGASDETVEHLYRYGVEIGQAFQIQDDLLDLTVPSETLGKQRGSDLVENKQTIVTLHAKQHGVDVENLVDADSVSRVTDPEIESALDELEDVGSLSFARNTAEDLIASGRDHLQALPDNHARDMLDEIARYLINRGY